jgi:hypothetical protein
MTDVEVIDEGREFPEALRRCFEGHPIRRSCWTKHFTVHVRRPQSWGGTVPVSPYLAYFFSGVLHTHGYRPSQSDLFASDWEILPIPKEPT